MVSETNAIEGDNVGSSLYFAENVEFSDNFSSTYRDTAYMFSNRVFYAAAVNF